MPLHRARIKTLEFCPSGLLPGELLTVNPVGGGRSITAWRVDSEFDLASIGRLFPGELVMFINDTDDHAMINVLTRYGDAYVRRATVWRQ